MDTRETHDHKQASDDGMADNAREKRPEGFYEGDILLRKVAKSGHISYNGRSYFVSKALVGNFLRVIVTPNRLIIDTTVPLHKEHPLRKGTKSVSPTDGTQKGF